MNLFKKNVFLPPTNTTCIWGKLELTSLARMSRLERYLFMPRMLCLSAYGLFLFIKFF